MNRRCRDNHRWPRALAAAAIMSGCSISTSDKCPAVAVGALEVTIRDATTGTPIGANTTVLATLRGTSVRDSSTQATFPGAGSASILIGGRSGLWDLVIRKPGYAEQTKSGIVVPAGGSSDCPFPATVHLTVDLQPAR